jgi:hypothetical protein
MSGFKRPLMPSGDDLDQALVTSTGKITRQSKPCSPLLRQRNHRGLGGYAILVDLGAPDLLRGAQHIPGLAAFQKSTVSGLMPISGLGGIQADRLIREVMELEALPAKPQEKAA